MSASNRITRRGNGGWHRGLIIRGWRLLSVGMGVVLGMLAPGQLHGQSLTAITAVANTTLHTNFAAPAFTPVTATGGSGPKTFALRDSVDGAPATLPAGLTFSTATGQISGTPTAARASTRYTVRVTDGAAPSASSSTIARRPSS
jgi:hypothetical protein